jgi:hypothetical protein
MNYKKQLENEKWQVKRRKILNRDKFKCVECGYESNLHVHHLYYIYNKMPWQYPNNALVTLCGRCHNKWHEQNDLEFRVDVCKKKYIPSSKRKVIIKKKKIICKPETKAEKQKKLAINRLKENKILKLELINSSNIENKEFYLSKVDAYTVHQLNKLLKKENVL